MHIIIPPKVQEPLQKPIMTRPVLYPALEDGIKMPQENCFKEYTLQTLFQGLDRINKKHI